MKIDPRELWTSLRYPLLAVTAGLSFSLLMGSAHWNTWNFWLTGLAAYFIVTGFELLVSATVLHDHMTPARFLFRTMLIVILMQTAFAGIYFFASTGTTYLARNGQPITDFTDALYFSAVTLLTVGYGDIVPVGDFRFTAVAEVYGGTLFIFAFFTWGLGVVGDRYLQRRKGR